MPGDRRASYAGDVTPRSISMSETLDSKEQPTMDLDERDLDVQADAPQWRSHAQPPLLLHERALLAALVASANLLLRVVDAIPDRRRPEACSRRATRRGSR